MGASEAGSKCPFCAPAPARVAASNGLAIAVTDLFPVTQGHTLIIPRRHVADYFGVTPAELVAIDELIRVCATTARRDDPSVGGFNVGLNCGAVAGQTIFHCHVHLIPRRAGDVEDPRGGVRGVIPGKSAY
jgi:ATP adenylyltransferase